MGSQDLGSFKTREEAMLAAEMEDALRGGTDPLAWRRTIRSEPSAGHAYTISGPPWSAYYCGPTDDWLAWFDTMEAAQAACVDDWSDRA